MSTALVLLTVLAGAAAQRITGMGFAILSAPFLILLVGGFEGVVMINLCAAFTSTVILARVRRDVQWSRWRLLIAGAALGVGPGVWVITVIPTEWLELTVGILVIVGLLSVSLGRARGSGDRHWPLITTGAISGFMSTSTGIGGPALSVYAVAVDWPHRNLVATVQPYFLVVGAMSLSAMLATQGPSGNADPVLWASILTTCTAGLVFGEWLSKHLSEGVSSRVLIAVALLGAVTASARGTLTIAGVLP